MYLKKTNGKRMDNQLHKRKRESINLQKSSTCLPKVNNENAVPKSSTYGFVSHFMFIPHFSMFYIGKRDGQSAHKRKRESINLQKE
ncbi:hypothetical protein CUMW_120770 [Citrus unshiu]|nr:hypothetical protein CUMW_120770 [Citrus unshiu]